MTAHGVRFADYNRAYNGRSYLNMRHWVYRVFDQNDELLYIGCTINPQQRWEQHKRRSRPFTVDAARYSVTGPFTRAEGLQYEQESIEAEDPRHNRTQSRYRKSPPRLKTATDNLRPATRRKAS